MEGVKILEEILNLFPSLTQSGAHEKGIVDRIPVPEIVYFNRTPYIIVPDPLLSGDNCRYGLAVIVYNDVTPLKTLIINTKTGVKIDEENIDYEKLDYDSIEYEFLPCEKNDEISCLQGGSSYLSVFAEEYDGNNIKRAVMPIGHDCRGMVYEINTENEMIQIMDVKDVNMAINAISNYQLQCASRGGLFTINTYMIEAYKELHKQGFGLEKNLIDIIEKDLSKGIREFIQLYSVNNDIPLDSIIMKIRDLGNTNHLFLRKALNDNKSFTQVIYDYLLNKDDVNTINYVTAWSNIKPVFSENIIQSKFDSFLKHGWVAGAEALKKISGFNPVLNNSSVQEGYNFLLSNYYKNDLDSSDYIKGFYEMREWTGIQLSSQLEEKFKNIYN